MAKEIDPKSTTRAKAFEFWMQAPNPMVTFFKTLNVTRLVKVSKKRGLKFNMLMDYCIGKAAASVKEFYMLPVNGKLMQYDSIAVNTIVKNDEDEVSSCDIPYSEDLATFNRDYLKYTKIVAESCQDWDLSENSMVIGTSAIIDTEIDGAVGMNSGMYNVDFAELEANMSSGNWDGNAKILSDAAKRLEIAGADFIVIATNTMHKLVPQIEKEIRIPILHIADATANCIKRDNIKKVALLGTKFTMTQDFIKNRLIEAGLEVMTPDAQDIELVNDVIFNELCLGKILDSSRKEYQRIITEMKNRGAEGVILGCTEIGMLISAKDSVLPTYDTTIIHATEAAKMALE